VSWTDSSGNFWLFGGASFDANGVFAQDFNDLWEFNPSTKQWAWMGGSNTISCASGATLPGCGPIGVYGTLGSPATGNVPGGRNDATSSTDSSGNLWLFGGQGFDSKGSLGNLNDLWEFNPSTKEWTWMSGSSTMPCYQLPDEVWCGQVGVYGSMGNAANGNVPGGRFSSSSWTDRSGNLWIFGGFGYGVSTNSNSAGVELNDLWEFNSSTMQWAWIGGSSTGNQPGVYGTLGVPAAGNIPGGRGNNSNWIDSSGNFWLFGGDGYGADGAFGFLNDLWEFNPSKSQWTWMGGSSTVGSNGSQPGVYGILGAPAAGNIPGGRGSNSTWTDSSGNFWLFGGMDFKYNGGVFWYYLNDLWRYQPLVAASTPSFNLASGTYTSEQTVSIADTTPGATIYYTLDGSTPTTGSAIYSTALTVNQTTTIKVIATASGYTTSAVASAIYVINLPPTAAPVFTPAADTYTVAQKVKITDSMKGASIFYTLDGSTPTTASAVYSKPLTVNQSTTINAIAVATGYSSSSVSSAIFIITIAAAPTFTPAAGTYGQAQWVTLASATPNPTIYYTTDGSTPSENSTQYTGPIAVNATTTIKAIATAIGYTDSPVASAKYTLVSSPRVFTGLASSIATPAATLNATVHDFESAGQVRFLWGTASTALNTSTDKVALPALSGAQSVSAPLTGLTSGTTYYFQPVAETVGGTSYGAIQSFTTN
jgi:N-acetylneuraminic acid mutarotase